MKQFDVFENPSKIARKFAPYLVVLSSHHLLDLQDVIVAPLVNDSVRHLSTLEIVVEIDERPLVLVISELFSLQARGLSKPVGSLLEHDDTIRHALERLFSGF